MKKIVYSLLVTVSGVLLVLAYRTSTQVVMPTASGTTAQGGDVAAPNSESTPTASPSRSASSGSTATQSATAPKTGLKDGTFVGELTDTRWGPVRVQITVAGGSITAADAVVYPTGSLRDQAINSRAIPILNSEAVKAQAASIDMVSGATVTSDGYIGSLQSAIDQAKA